MIVKTILDVLYVIGLAATPVLELRAAIPFGIAVLKMNTWLVFVLAIVGNMIPVFVLLKYLDPIVQFIFKHVSFLKKHVEKYFERLHTKHSQKANTVGATFLAIFVAIPLPGTGAWSAAVIAYLFNIPPALAWKSILVGIIGAALIMVAFSESAIHIFSKIW